MTNSKEEPRKHQTISPINQMNQRPCPVLLLLEHNLLTILLSERSEDAANTENDQQQRRTPETSNNLSNQPNESATVSCSTASRTQSTHYTESINTAGVSSFQSTSATTSTPIRSGQNVLNHFRTLFSPYARPSPLCSNRGSTHASSVSARGLSRRPAVRTKKPRYESWTHKMFCLSRASEEQVPNREEKELLQRAGLGRLKIKFNATGSMQTFKEELENTFPKLMCGGGFELLKRLPGNNLEVIPPPAIGYSVEHLKKCGNKTNPI
ncbi:Hypothetical predicted protein [Paramuricea clavata]|uniref:Uncharacterized protein n=1 Tax=Paramuricea clavata TaxID=317549 RepID=A0A6S7IXH4_PARCT|nr:Hypothetical predicted protein [Paramuricea clavata]